jgi:hypothetical protein
MTLQEIIKSIDDLPPQDQTSLFHLLERRLAPMTDRRSVTLDEAVPAQPPTSPGETFWEMTLRFRERIEREGLEFTDADFADLRDRRPGRKLEWEKTQRVFQQYAAKADFARFDALMARVPDVKPVPGDELL